ncbi:hypothetical protein HK102_005233 [Quaeritorhiza haematococci]|nr:hypothetical protein HK102_005233 [Quaeritorhiza haematococci]
MPLPPGQKLPKTAEEWKQLGNIYFKADDFQTALVAYNRGIELDPHSTLLKLNRAVTNLQIGKYRAAIKDALEVLDRHGKNEKAHYRAAKGFYCIGDYASALQHFESAVAINPLNALAKEEIENTKRRLREREEGASGYDFEELRDQAKPFVDSEEPVRQIYMRLDAAEYVGPVDIRPASETKKGARQGLVATTEVQPGTLLICSKGVMVVYHKEIGDEEYLDPEGAEEKKKKKEKEGLLPVFGEFGLDAAAPQMILATISSYAYREAKVTVSREVLEQMRANPVLKEQINALYAGPEYPLPNVSIDLFRPGRRTPIHETPNGIPGSGKGKGSKNKADEPPIDIKRFDRMCTHNFIDPGLQKHKLHEEQPSDRYSGCGLWLLPSMLNHSCVPNAYRMFYGDLMFVFASRHIKPGQEITVSYIQPTIVPIYEDRQKLLEKHGILSCECEWCVMDRSEPQAVQTRRRVLMNQWTKCIQPYISPHNIVSFLPEVSCHIETLRKHYLEADRKKYLFCISTLLNVKAKLLNDEGQNAKLAETLEELLAIGGHSLQTTTSTPAGKKKKKKKGGGGGGANSNASTSNTTSLISSSQEPMMNPIYIEPCLWLARTLMALERTSDAGRWVDKARHIGRATMGMTKQMFDQRYGPFFAKEGYSL